MRRKDRECADLTEIMRIIDRADTLFLAVETENFPYCLPVNFARKDNYLYIHSALTGTKLDCIKRRSHVGFSAAIDIDIDVDNSTTYYKSVCGNGNAKIITDEAEKGQALDLLAIKYNARCARPALPRAIRSVAIIRIEILEASAKINLPPAD